MLTIVSVAPYICGAKTAHNQGFQSLTNHHKTISHAF